MKTSTILLAGIAALCATPAVAETMSVPVSFAGLDLTSPNGKSILDRRIDHAARVICGTPDIRDIKAMMAAGKCRAETVALAQPRVAIAIAAAQPAVRVASVH